MPIERDLVRRSGDLKRELVEFAHRTRFDRAWRQMLDARLGRPGVADEGEIINLLDAFILQHRLADGRTVVEHFAAEHPELPPAEREMLLGWRDVVEGVFAVERRDGEALIAVNLVDELTYRVRSNLGPAVFARTPPGAFFIGRLVPVKDEWLISGSMSVLPASSRTDAYRLAADMAGRYPSLVFRNPENLEQGWELQRAERRHFIDFFGSDLVVMPGRELAERMRAYGRFRMHDVRDAEGQSAVDRAKREYGVTPPELDFRLPDHLLEAETVGVIYDEVDGLNFLADFGRVEEAFADPELASERRHRLAVLTYIEDSTISPRLLLRLAERDPGRASRVFQQVLKQPRFSWERDGEALLRRHKASYFERPVLPGVTPMSPALAQQTRVAVPDRKQAPAGGRGSSRRAPRPRRSRRKHDTGRDR
jgi:hypothetical protein